MKKYICRALAIFIFLAVFVPAELKAVDLGVGLTTWYANWDTPSNIPVNYDAAFLYGPVLSAKFNDEWSMTLVFLYGQYKKDREMGIYTASTKIDRYDSDLAMNYRINNYIKLFAGAKLMKYDYKESYDDGAGNSFSGTVNHTSVGPGAGISGVFPLGNDFFILANISGMYLWGSHDGKSSSSGTFAGYYEFPPSSKMKEYGINSSLSLAYYISSWSTTINLGFRYQAFITSYNNKDVSKDTDSKFWGVTLAAVYTFTI